MTLEASNGVKPILHEKRRSILRVLLISSITFAVVPPLGGCGKRSPPLPPVESVPQRTELLSGVQRGNQVILSWPAPRRNASSGSLQSIRRIDIYRLAEEVKDPLPITEEDFSARSTLIASIPFENFSDNEGTLSYTDQLTLTEPVRLRYAVRYVNDAGQRAGFSNFLLIEPASSVSRPPALNSPPEVSENAVVLSWMRPDSNVDNTTPVNLLGYNVYRATRAQDEPAERPLNSEPLTGERYADGSFEFGREYVYVVRAVSLGTGGNRVESLNSNAVSVTPVDTFPPSPPEGVTAAATANPPRISIFFAASTKRDVVGYNLFRSTDANLPKAEWTKLNSRLLDRTTFQDESVSPGTRYFYYLTAVDRAGNASQPSEVATEIVP